MPKNELVRFGKYYSLMFLLPVSMLVGFVLGYFLDKVFGTTFLKAIFLIVGFAAGMIELIRGLNKDDKAK